MKSYFSKEDMETLVNSKEGICVSIYMQTPKANIDSKKLLIKLKNVLSDIEQDLIKMKMSKKEIQMFVDQAKQFFIDSSANGLLRESIAIFFSFGKIFTYILPVVTREKVIIETDFYTEPLKDFLDSCKNTFYILLLSQKNIILYESNPYEMREIELKEISESMKEFLGNDNFSSNLRFRSSLAQSNNKIASFFYSIGDKKSEEKKNQLQRFFASINNAVTKKLHGKKDPLILAGVDYLFPIYKMANTYYNLVNEGIKGSPDKMKKEQIHRDAIKIIGRKA